MIWVLTNSPHSIKVLSGNDPIQGLIFVDKYHHYNITSHRLDIPVTKRWRGKTNACEWELHRTWVGDYYLLVSPLIKTDFWTCIESITNKRLINKKAKLSIRRLGKYYKHRVHTRTWFLCIWKYCKSDFNILPPEMMCSIVQHL